MWFDLVGQKFGRWLVIEEAGRDKHGRRLWTCKCECGKQKDVPTNVLLNGESQSCGCLRHDRYLEAVTKHGCGKKIKGSDRYATREYCIWQNMKQRCYNPNYKQFMDYGGRGIGMFEPWIESFETFYEFIGPCPSENHSIDRYPNNDGNYEPGNVRWATKKEQAEHRRNNRWFEYNGENKIISQWAEILGVRHNLILYHLKKGKPFSEIYEHFIKRKNRCPV